MMTPTHQITPAPRQLDGGHAGGAYLEIAQSPFSGNRRGAPVNYSALLRRHRPALGMIFAGMLVLSLLFTLLENKVYRSEAILEVTGINQDFLNTKGVDPTANQLSGDAYIETQTKLLTSPPVVERTVQLLGPKVPPAIAARQSLSGVLSRWLDQPAENQPEKGDAVVLGMLADAQVKVDGTSDLITLTMFGPEPQLTADTANVLIAQYIELSQQVRGDSAGNTNRFLLAQLADARQNLRESESELQDYARQSAIVIPNASQESVAGDKQQSGVVSDQSSKEVRYDSLKKAVDADRDIYQAMLRRVKQAGIVAALKSSDVRVVSPATPQPSPYRPNLGLNLALGLLFGIGLSTVYILVRERNDASLRIPGQSVRQLNLAELAVVPSARLRNSARIPLTLRNLKAPEAEGEGHGFFANRPAVVDKDMVQWCQEETMMADAYRSAITSILLSRVNGVAPRVLLVTSPRPKAWKTTTVANLGISLAEIGRRVLLIDADLRCPRLGRLFGLQFSSGLSDVLLDGGTLESVVRSSTVPGLYVLPGGSEPGNISKLLHSATLDSLVQSARSEYDFVLIDTPPMVGMADARLLSRVADGVILISRAGETSPEQLGDARQRLVDDGTTVIGTILNGCDLRREDPAYVNSYNSYAGRLRD
jgi:capsular exopolysaccharide synthesis family protein